MGCGRDSNNFRNKIRRAAEEVAVGCIWPGVKQVAQRWLKMKQTLVWKNMYLLARYDQLYIAFVNSVC